MLDILTVSIHKIRKSLLLEIFLYSLNNLCSGIKDQKYQNQKKGIAINIRITPIKK